MHDSTVDRTTNGSGEIADLTDSYLKSLSLRNQNGTPTEVSIPLFSEVLDNFKDKNIMLMLDVKGKIYPKVIDLVVSKHMQSKCILLTFSESNTLLAKERTNEILISALVQSRADWESIVKLNIPAKQLIAYVNRDTPPDLLQEINSSEVILMTDVSEGIRNNGNRYESGYYHELASKLQLGIMICDFPLYVSKIFCPH